jgi:hypothetical protein
VIEVLSVEEVGFKVTTHGFVETNDFKDRDPVDLGAPTSVTFKSEFWGEEVTRTFIFDD